LIARFEQLAGEVWPAAETLELGSWQLGFSDGCTKRANSVRCGAGEPGDLLDAVERCEALYCGRGLPTIFKLTEADVASGLDLLLDARGYRVVDPTSVQLRDALLSRAPLGEPADSLRVEHELSDAFSAACMRLNGVAAEMHGQLREILLRAQQRCRAMAFASVERDGEIVAQGVGVEQGGLVCLCEIVAAPAQRRRGLASVVVAALCQWAGARGAQPWLQVVAANSGALALYDQFGFREAYRYWYRVSS
jgi:GNAT superfamily N-acetyltransferase